MKVAFVSNYYNHHQAPFSKKMEELTNGNFYFIEMDYMTEERKKMGWGGIEIPSFVIQYNASQNLCNKIINDVDVLILGDAPYQLIKKRLKMEKLTFLYSERIHKKGYNYLKLIKHIPQFYFKYGRYKKFFLLCASAFTSFDFSKTFTFCKKAYKWGYFPISYLYDDINSIFDKKVKKGISIIYVSRLIKWKHPELAIKVANRLKNDNINFNMTIIGDGNMKDDLIKMSQNLDLVENIKFIVSEKNEKIREHMISSNIFLFTSDKEEGWGAVLNEAMNSMCAVVASSEIGSVPYLLKNGVNGFIYKDGDFNDLYEKVFKLCIDKNLRYQFGIEAYNTIVNNWNYSNAASRFLILSESLLNEKQIFFESGPCSKANIIKDGWFKK